MPKKSKKELKAEAEAAAAAKIAAAAARRQKLGLAEDATDAECAAAEEFAEIAASITDLPTLAKAAGTTVSKLVALSDDGLKETAKMLGAGVTMRRQLSKDAETEREAERARAVAQAKAEAEAKMRAEREEADRLKLEQAEAAKQQEKRLAEQREAEKGQKALAVAAVAGRHMSAEDKQAAAKEQLKKQAEEKKQQAATAKAEKAKTKAEAAAAKTAAKGEAKAAAAKAKADILAAKNIEAAARMKAANQMKAAKEAQAAEAAAAAAATAGAATTAAVAAAPASATASAAPASAPALAATADVTDLSSLAAAAGTTVSKLVVLSDEELKEKAKQHGAGVTLRRQLSKDAEMVRSSDKNRGADFDEKDDKHISIEDIDALAKISGTTVAALLDMGEAHFKRSCDMMGCSKEEMALLKKDWKTRQFGNADDEDMVSNPLDSDAIDIFDHEGSQEPKKKGGCMIL